MTQKQELLCWGDLGIGFQVGLATRQYRRFRAPRMEPLVVFHHVICKYLYTISLVRMPRSPVTTVVSFLCHANRLGDLMNAAPLCLTVADTAVGLLADFGLWELIWRRLVVTNHHAPISKRLLL